MFPLPYHLQSYTPFIGNWFFDLKPQYVNHSFDITRPSHYPAYIDASRNEEIMKAIDNLRDVSAQYWNSLVGEHLGEVAFYSASLFRNDFTRVSEAFYKLVGTARREAAKMLSLQNSLAQFSTGIAPIANSDHNKISYKIRPKRDFFFNMVKRIIFNDDPLQKVAKNHDLNPTNLAIWTITYLNYGVNALYAPQDIFNRSMQEIIVEDHLLNKNSIIHTCVKYNILNVNKLLHMIHRYRSRTPSISIPLS